MNDYYETNDICELAETAAKSPALLALAETYGLDPWDIGLQMLQFELKENAFRK